MRARGIVVGKMVPKNRPATRRLPSHVARAIAVAAQTDPRTVARVIAGQPTRAATRDRIVRALHDRERVQRMATRLERQP